MTYESTPGPRANAPFLWPASSSIKRAPNLPTIVVFAHPHCPCTKATIGELALLMTRVYGQATAAVVFIDPDGVPEHWAETDLWRDAAAIPGVTVVGDRGDREVDLFGAQASGQTMLYDTDGHLKFNGGITAARGHSGDNVGRSSIAALITGDGDAVAESSVFGCNLHSPTISLNQEDGNGR